MMEDITISLDVGSVNALGTEQDDKPPNLAQVDSLNRGGMKRSWGTGNRPQSPAMKLSSRPALIHTVISVARDRFQSWNIFFKYAVFAP